MILLDTDICLSLLKGNLKSSEILMLNEDLFCVAECTVQELYYAANRSSDPVGNKIIVEKFLLTVRILHSDLAVLRYCADVLLVMKKKGMHKPLSDVMMFSLSKVYGVRLITSNGRRYCFT
jgi:Predicted nucleic acid-binding protein, contains PIN domain